MLLGYDGSFFYMIYVISDDAHTSGIKISQQKISFGGVLLGLNYIA